MSIEKSKKTIVVDLDNTLADYTGGWEANKHFPGKPRKDVVDGLIALKQAGFIIGILTTRPVEIVKEWLFKYQLLDYQLLDLVDFVNDNPDQPKDAGKHKPIAFAYIDDRAIRYSGNNMSEIVSGILSGKYEPWKKEKKEIS